MLAGKEINKIKGAILCGAVWNHVLTDDDLKNEHFYWLCGLLLGVDGPPDSNVSL